MENRKPIRRACALGVAAAATLILPTASAAPGELALASTADDGTKSNGSSYSVSLSEDGTRVAFSTTASNLGEGETDGYRDVYVKNLTSGQLSLVSTDDGGTKSNLLLADPVSMSADGTHVAFSTTASNVSKGDTDSEPDVYVKNLSTGELTLASTNDVGLKGNDMSFHPSLSADGTSVAFTSYASNLDPAASDGRRQVYVKDLSTGEVTLASTGDAGTPGLGHSQEPSLSADGTRVAFSSHADNLDASDRDPYPDVYVKDLTTGELTLISTFNSKQAREISERPSLSADGSRVAFSSYAHRMSQGDADHVADIYVKDVSTDELTLASTADDGVKGNHHSLEPSLSQDGIRVAFSSAATNLGEGDHDDDYDVYVKDLSNGGLILASAADRTSDGTSLHPSLSADRTSVGFISTATNLTPADSDTLPDVYVNSFGEVPPGESVPMCRNRAATVYVARGYVVGGPDAAGRYTGVLHGTKERDVVVGTDQADLLYGGRGDDVVCARHGDDNLRGGAGEDVVKGQAGGDTLKGGRGADRFVGGPGRDVAKDYNPRRDTLRSVP